MNEIQGHIASWVRTHARPLEQSIVCFLLGQGSKEEAINALKAYQHPNGSFGKGLEPDCLNPEPSPIQSWFSTHYIKILGLDSSHELVQSLIAYLLETIDETGMFDTIIPSNNQYPHAPWWHDNVTNRRWGYNPTASLLGFLFLHHDDKRLIGWIDQAIETSFTYETFEMHELVSFVELYDSIKDKRDLFTDFDRFEMVLRAEMIRLAGDPKVLESDTYGVKPSMYCQRPDMFGCQVLHDALEIEINMIRSFMSQGDIPKITWQWGQYEKAFQTSAVAWQGILMMNALLLLDLSDRN
ncbi:MAG: hypothetical protein K9K93_02115 [Acholeplasmataceae bacterium]|nr:hypothetical protein [Acholeplasmataceae bacterium]